MDRIAPEERLLNLFIALSSTRARLTKQDIRSTVYGYDARMQGEDAKADTAFERMFERDKEDLRRLGVPLQTVVDAAHGADIGYRIDPSAALDFAKAITEIDGVEFAGLMTWEGHTMGVKDPAERIALIENSVRKVLDAADAIKAAGIPVEIVSCGGTGTYLTTAAMVGVTEVQAGGGIWGDELYMKLDAKVNPALTLMTTVVSRPTPTRVIVDAGRKTVDPSNVAPTPLGVKVEKPPVLSAEHGNVTLAEPSDCPKVGDHLCFRIGYSDQVMHLHECLYGVRNGIVEQIIPIAGRGRLQ